MVQPSFHTYNYLKYKYSSPEIGLRFEGTNPQSCSLPLLSPFNRCNTFVVTAEQRIPFVLVMLFVVENVDIEFCTRNGRVESCSMRPAESLSLSLVRVWLLLVVRIQ